MKVLKKIFHISFLALLMGLGSCSKSFLELKNPNDVTLNNFWRTQEDAMVGLAGVYDAFQDQSLAGQLYSRFDVPTDNVQSVNQTGFNEIENSTHNPSIETIGNFWAHNYDVIQRANVVIDNVSSMPQSAIDNAAMKRIVAEAAFLRALAYLDLISLYGDVPFYTHPVTPFDEGKGKTPKTEIYSYLTQELITDVIPNLPSTGSGENGRVTNGAAEALLGKYYLYEKQWSKAASCFGNIISSDLYALYPDYQRLFTLDGEYSSEGVFEIGFVDGGIDDGEKFSVQIDTTVKAVVPNGIMTPTKGLVESYLCIDGLPVSGPNKSPLYDSKNPYANRDLRLRGSIYTNADQSPEGKKYWNFKNVNSWAIRKYTWYTSGDEFLRGPQNYYMIRYADVLLMYAEAQNEAVGPDNSIYHALILIRKRAGFLPGANGLYGLADNMTQEQMRTVIQNERRWEFAFERSRYFDLRRWGIIDSIINSINPNPRAKAFTAPRDWLWPYPQSEMDNNPALKSEGQNPGWD